MCLAAYALVDAEPVKQGALVVASVAAAALFLPDLSSELWSMDAAKIRDLVPRGRVDTMITELVASYLRDPTWAKDISAYAVADMVTAHETPLWVQWDLSYDSDILLDHIVLPQGSRTFHQVNVALSSRRLMPPEQNAEVWISAARTPAGLFGEYKGDGCLMRELVPLDGAAAEEWITLAEQLCQVSLVLADKSVALNRQTVVQEGEEVLRWIAAIPAGVDRAAPVDVLISMTFPLDSMVHSFPVVFGSYYCAGRTEVSCKISSRDDKFDLRFTDFLTRRAGQKGWAPQVTRRTNGSRVTGIQFNVTRGAVLWPGSGIMFDWATEGQS